jgi:hypothetical protein
MDLYIYGSIIIIIIIIIIITDLLYLALVRTFLVKNRFSVYLMCRIQT